MNYYASLVRRIKFLESIIIEGKHDQEVLQSFLGDEYYNKYNIIKNKIKDPEYKDIYKLITKNPNEVKNYIDNIQSNADKIKEDKKGAKLLYEDANWKVYRITTYNAAKYYSKNTKWCISGNFRGHEDKGEAHFNEYLASSDGGFYFYINKRNPSDKWCIIRNMNGDIELIYDAEDNIYISTEQLDNMGTDIPYWIP